MLDKSRIAWDKDGYVVLNKVLAGKDGLSLRQQCYGAFATGAFLTTGGIENETSHPRGLDEICAGVNGDLSAFGLKGYSIVLHFVERCS
jgi:hypothetical protein